MPYWHEHVACPRCGGLASHTDHISSGDWWMTCLRCGLVESRHHREAPRSEGSNDLEDIIRTEGRGAYRLTPRDGSAIEAGALSNEFGPEMIGELFDLEVLARDYDPAQSYITHYDPRASSVTRLWGDLEPSMFIEGIHDSDY